MHVTITVKTRVGSISLSVWGGRGGGTQQRWMSEEGECVRQNPAGMWDCGNAVPVVC